MKKASSVIRKEILIDDLIRLDFFDDDAMHDIKKGRSMEEAHRAQLLYYLYYLRIKGIERKGILNYPKQKRSVELELTPDAVTQVKLWIQNDVTAPRKALRETGPIAVAPRASLVVIFRCSMRPWPLAPGRAGS
jgi:hypothetical protein